jgi:hypothetical protein
MKGLLRIQADTTYKPEREYILQVLLGDFLGLDYEIDYCQEKKWLITNADGKELILPDILFQVPESNWLTVKSLPRRPLPKWDTSKTIIDCPLVHPEVPIMFGDIDNNKFQFGPNNSQLRIPIDIIGSAFFMLTRYEEIVRQERDKHERFPAKASLAYLEGFLDRPIINEYLEMLWWCIKSLWPALKRTKKAFRVILTHDIDRPLRYNTTMQVIKAMGSELIKKRNFRDAAGWLAGGLRRAVNVRSDPFYQGVLRIMDISERYGFHSSFNFMGASRGDRDFGYNPSGPVVQELIKMVQRRGLEIGFHPGYTTATDLQTFSWEKQRVEKACGHSVAGGRQHYLRFKVPETWRIWQATGATYDSSLGYAERAGFRCGVCWPYSVFDLLERTSFSLEERPPIVMDGQLKAEFNEALTPDQAYGRVMQLAHACRRVSGDFVLVWHNSSVSNEWEKWGRLYERLVADFAEMNG